MVLVYYYFVCAIGGQHDGHLPFWLLWLCRTYYVVVTCFVCLLKYFLVDLTKTQRIACADKHSANDEM